METTLALLFCETRKMRQAIYISNIGLCNFY